MPPQIPPGDLLADHCRIALYHNRLEVVQASLLGSILVNLLLILGIAILAGSFHHHELSQNRQEGQTLACLLSFSVLSLLIPVSKRAGSKRLARSMTDRQ